MGFFDNIDFSDVAVGAIEAVDVGVQKSIEKYEKDKTRLRDIRYTTKKAAYDKFETQVEDNATKIKEAASVFGGNVDAVYSLIESEGSLDAAVTAANEIKAIQKNQGIDPLTYLGMAEASPTGVTVSQLARYTATPIKTTPGPKSEDVATGFMSFIPGAGERAVESIETGVRADLAAAGYEEMGSREEILASMPEATANKLKPYMLGRVADPQQEMKRLINIQSNLYAQGKKEEADSIKNEVTRLAGVVTMTDKDNYTPNLSIATKGNVEQLISSKYGLGGDYNAQGAWMSAHNDRQVVTELDRVGSYAEGFIEEAVKDGVSYGFATRKINEFIRDNKNFVYIPNPDGYGPGEFKEAEGELFAVGLIGERSDDLVDQSTTDEAEVGDASTAGSVNQAAPDANIARLQQMDPNSTEAQALRAKILRTQDGAKKLAEAGL
jgi:hypothetical protein